MRKIVRSAVRASLPVMAIMLTVSAAQADTAKDYNLFVTGNFTGSNSDVEGRVAVGGNATLTNYDVGLKAPSGGAPDSLVVGGALTFTNGTVRNGGIVAGSGSASNVTVFKDGVGTPNAVTLGDIPIDISAEGARLLSLSTTLAGTAASGTTSLSYGTLTFTGTLGGLNVFTVSGAQLAAANGFNVILPANSYALFNIDGKTDIFQNMGMSLQGTTAQNILLNFYEATSLSISGIGVMGSILAPSADVNFNNGAINGNVMAASLQGVGQINYAPYQGTLLDAPTAAVPEPASWAMAICGFGLVGAAMRRRRMTLRPA